MATWIILFIALFSLVGLYYGIKLISWSIVTTAILLVSTLTGWLSGATAIVWWAIFIVVAIVLNIRPIRKKALSNYLFRLSRKSIPKLSETEEIALNAGDTWIEEDLFRGQPKWEKLHRIPKHQLSDEEQSFLDNETEELCALVNDWQVMNDHDLPENIWQFMREKGFFGLVIDKKYGGKGFSAKAHSDIVFKVATRSGVAAVTVMVPNSLGPGELLYHYGTESQKNHYLPRLAQGKEIPCFALTEPEAGSDATSIQSSAIVCKGKINGEEVVGLKLNFNKRYITLAPVATLVGLAVDLKDPANLLNGEGKEGITCVLLPRTQQGLEIGNRHLPSYMPFMNGTVRGKDIFVPLDYIIGGQKMAGDGWRMLVECLSIGRSISLPALGTASSAVSFYTSSAYSYIRKQFGLEIGKFEGIEEVLARIGGLSYLTQATRELTVAAVDAGIKPSVASAIAKYHNTEHGRMAVNDGMDLHGGRAVIAGPNNYFTTAYLGIPVSITVEGANIMTRNLLIFGQGAMACHPFVRKEFYALNQGKSDDFDELLWAHIGYYARNILRTIVSSFTCGVLIKAQNSPLKKYYKRIERLSYAFSWISDLSLMYLGASLKRKERLSARLGDILSHLYMASATLKYFRDHGEKKEEMAYAQWALEYSLYHAQEALIEFSHNFPSKIIGWFIRNLSFPYGRAFKGVSDKLDHKVAKSAMTNDAYRAKVETQLFTLKDKTDPLGRVDLAFTTLLALKPTYLKLTEAMKKGTLKKAPIDQLILKAFKASVISEDEKNQLLDAEKQRLAVLQVDEFSFDALKKGHDVTESKSEQKVIKMQKKSKDNEKESEESQA